MHGGINHFLGFCNNVLPDKKNMEERLYFGFAVGGMVTWWHE